MKEFGSIPEDVKSATLSLRVRLKGDFLTFYRNRNTANQKSLISPQPQGLAVGPLTAKKSSCTSKTALSTLPQDTNFSCMLSARSIRGFLAN